MSSQLAAVNLRSRHAPISPGTATGEDAFKVSTPMAPYGVEPPTGNPHLVCCARRATPSSLMRLESDHEPSRPIVCRAARHDGSQRLRQRRCNSGQRHQRGLARHCASIDGNARVAIEAYDGNAVSVCAPGGEDDCLYSHAAGKTFLYATPDFNADGMADAVIKDFTGAYGQHDVVHVTAFAQCGDGSYIQVADDMLQDVSIAPSTNAAGWADLQVTRTCYNAALGDSETRRFRLAFDAARFRYGPPDNDPELAQFCSAKELSLPADAAESSAD